MARHTRVATTYQALGGGGGHHHGGGGRRYPGPWIGGAPWWGYGYDPGVQLFTIDDREPATNLAACPKSRQPVLASDGLVYDNACLARAAGVKVVKMIGKTPMKMSGMGAWSASIQSDGEISADTKQAFWGGVVAGALGLTLARLVLR